MILLLVFHSPSLEVTEYASYRRFAGSLEASVDMITSVGFQLAATVNCEAALPLKKLLPPSDAPPTCTSSTTWDLFPNQNLTGVGAGAALMRPLNADGFGGDTDGRGLHSSTSQLNGSAFCGIGVHCEVI